MLKVYPLSMAKAAPEHVDDPDRGVDNLALNGDNSYDSVLCEESEFEGIQGVREYLDFLMKKEVFLIKALEAHGYPSDPEEVRQMEYKYRLSGGFGDWEWEIDYDWCHDCLVFLLWMND